MREAVERGLVVEDEVVPQHILVQLMSLRWHSFLYNRARRSIGQCFGDHARSLCSCSIQLILLFQQLLGTALVELGSFVVLFFETRMKLIIDRVTTLKAVPAW